METLRDNIYNLDCMEGMSYMDDESVDLVLTSPPYFNAREYSQWDTYEDYLNDMVEVFRESTRVLKEGRMLIINVSPVLEKRKSRSHESKRYPIPFDLVYLLTRELDLLFIEDIIWKKPEGASYNRNGGFFRHRKPVAYKPNIVTEYVLVFRKKSNKLIDHILRKSETLEDSLVLGEYEKTNVWEISPARSKEHPAIFPEELSDKCILYYSFKDDIVLDMFMGSGTTAVSCIKNNRGYIGFERDLDYYSSSLKRIENHK